MILRQEERERPGDGNIGISGGMAIRVGRGEVGP